VGKKVSEADRVRLTTTAPHGSVAPARSLES
jgi:hypothetical protein